MLQRRFCVEMEIYVVNWRCCNIFFSKRLQFCVGWLHALLIKLHKKLLIVWSDILEFAKIWKHVRFKLSYCQGLSYVLDSVFDVLLWSFVIIGLQPVRHVHLCSVHSFLPGNAVFDHWLKQKNVDNMAFRLYVATYSPGNKVQISHSGNYTLSLQASPRPWEILAGTSYHARASESLSPSQLNGY